MHCTRFFELATHKVDSLRKKPPFCCKASECNRIVLANLLRAVIGFSFWNHSLLSSGRRLKLVCRFSVAGFNCPMKSPAKGSSLFGRQFFDEVGAGMVCNDSDEARYGVGPGTLREVVGATLVWKALAASAIDLVRPYMPPK